MFAGEDSVEPTSLAESASPAHHCRESCAESVSNPLVALHIPESGHDVLGKASGQQFRGKDTLW